MSTPSRAGRIIRRIALLAVAVAAATLVWFIAYGGRFLQHEDPLARADVAFVLAGSRAERWMEAVDLYREGYVPRILLSAGAIEPAERELRRRGIRFMGDSERNRDAMIQLGVRPSDVLTPDDFVDNTAQEAALLRGLAAQHGWHRVIIVTSKYHTRRAGFAFRRALRGSGIQVIMRATHYDPSDPARWWRHRADCRWILEEWEKLIAYWCGLSE